MISELNLNYSNNINNMINQNSSIKFGEEDPEKSKSKKKKKGLKRFSQIVSQDETFNIYGLGEIKYAELHGKANRPLKQITDELDPSIQKCPCCNLPVPDEEQKYLKPYSTCDNPDEFSNCGQGVVLYYSFIKYIIINLFIVSICVSCFNLYFSFKYYKELEKVCNNYLKTEFSPFSGYTEKCQFYFTEASEDFEYYKSVDSIFFMFSSVNVRDYIQLFGIIYSENDGSFKSSIINISRINFCCLIFIFAFNLVYIYFLYNKSNAADYLVFTVSDYSIFLYNLYDVHGTFLTFLKEIETKKQNCGNKLPDSEYEKIGGIPKIGSSELDIFKEFLKNKICKGKFDENFVINRIDFCYKLEELAKLQKKYNNCLEMISKIEYDPKIINQNKKENLVEDDRKYIKFSFCSTEEKKLSVIKQEKDELEKKINELIEDSRRNTSNYFGGAALVTFDTIKEQELFLKNLPSNSIEYFFNFLRNMAYLFCCCCFNKTDINYLKRNIKFEAAPEPEDIIFENLEISPFAKTMRTALVYIISIIICSVSFVIIVALNYLQVYINGLDSTDHALSLYIISFIITGVTSGIDVFLGSILKTLTKIEKQSTKTDFFLSYSIKLTLFTFLNSALLPLFSELFINKSDGHVILISNMFMKFVVNAFVSPMMWTLNFSYFFKKNPDIFHQKKN